MRGRPKKGNVRHFSEVLNYGRCFFNNRDDLYFIYDAESEPIVAKHTWTADKRRGSKSVDAVTVINGEKKRLHEMLLPQKTGEDNTEIDHINGITLDERKCNIRRGTVKQNLCNRPMGLGQIRRIKESYVLTFPDKNIRKMKFTNKADAEKAKREIQNEMYGEWSFDNSQKIARKNGIYEFIKDPYVDDMFNSGTLGNVASLPNDNPLKQKWYDLKAMIKGNLISEWIEFNLVMDLVTEYHNFKKDK